MSRSKDSSKAIAFPIVTVSTGVHGWNAASIWVTPLRSWISRAADCRPASRLAVAGRPTGAAAVTGAGATARNPATLTAHRPDVKARDDFERIRIATTAVWTRPPNLPTPSD